MAVKLEESLKREEERIAKQLPRLVGYAAKQRALMQELSEGVSWLGRSRVPAADPSHKSGVARSVS
jgi:rRNA processing protein Krr1/Pno1